MAILQPILKIIPEKRRWEVDILAVNGDEVVAVEVKTTLNVEYVDRFVDFLKDFKTLLREHRDKKRLWSSGLPEGRSIL